MGRFSGKFVLRVTPQLHEHLRVTAFDRAKSLNQFCNELITNALKQSEPDNKKQPQWENVISYLRKNFKSSFIGLILFGSAARSELTESSDIDLLIVLKNDIKLSRKLYTDWDNMNFRLDGHEITAQFVHLNDPAQVGSIWYEAAIEGRILMDTDETVFSLLKSLREMMAASKIRRAVSNGHPYWIKTENEEKNEKQITD